MSDVLANVGATKRAINYADERQVQLQAIRVLAKHDALDLVPMLFGPTSDIDADERYRMRKRGELA